MSGKRSVISFLEECQKFVRAAYRFLRWAQAHPNSAITLILTSGRRSPKRRNEFFSKRHKIWFTISRRSSRINKNVSDVYFPCRIFWFSPIIYFQLLLLNITFVTCSYIHIIVILRATVRRASVLQATVRFPLRIPMGIRIECLWDAYRVPVGCLCGSLGVFLKTI
jgi:hypothetical protein